MTRRVEDEEPEAPSPLERLARVQAALESPPPRWGVSILAYASDEELERLEALITVGPGWCAANAETLLAVLRDRQRRDESWR